MKPVGAPLVADRAADLVPWVAADVFGAAEVHAAEVLTRADATASAPVALGAAFALWAPLHGHVCFDVARAAELVDAAAVGPGADEVSRAATLPWPPLDVWLRALRDSPLVRVADGHDPDPVLDERPFVLHGTRLYGQRQWIDECVVAVALRARAGGTMTILGPGGREMLGRFWPGLGDAADDAQRRAAAIATSTPLTAVVGGPGSGKTYTVTGILAALLADGADRAAECSIALAAPTGKAAQRMRETIATALRQGDPARAVPQGISSMLERIEPTTLHRLLGPLPAVRTRFRHDALNPLPHDVVVVDETSMVALPMMARLLDALRADARLILIGDPDQLESIEAGAVLADVVDASVVPGSPIDGHVARLGRSRRQREESPIGPLSDAIREGRADDVLDQLRNGWPDLAPGEQLVTFVETSEPLDGADAVRSIVAPSALAARTAAEAGRLRAAIDSTAACRVLCGHRRGRFGVETWNAQIESWVRDGVPGRRNFAGRPLLVTRNDLRNRLSNGDSGVIASTAAGLVAAFDVGGEIRTFAPAQLESVETAFATTVHKSQGSEYDTVVVVLPPPSSSLASRELLYTAVTRTTRRLVVVGSAASVVACVSTRTLRATGLAGALAVRGARGRGDAGTASA
jgi:exodeoxyribonuclease V alpha subunit